MHTDAGLLPNQAYAAAVAPRREFIVEHLGHLGEERIIETAAVKPAEHGPQRRPEFLRVGLGQPVENQMFLPRHAPSKAHAGQRLPAAGLIRFNPG